MTTLLVAANGGHLSQLIELSARMDCVTQNCLWVTFDSPQSRSLLEGRSAQFIRPIEERDVPGVFRGIASAYCIMRRVNVTAVVSTGSGIALSFLPYAAMRGIPAYYIESAARVGAPSLTGRLLANVPGVQLYRQYPQPLSGRWRYAGSVFDGFEATECGPRQVRRIVVTLGSGVHGFHRLVDRLVAILPSHVDVLWQTGSTVLRDLPIEARAIVPAETLEKAIREADAVIGHAGCGTALSALKSGKYPILVPREQQHGELVDSHQAELARFLNECGLALHRSPERITFDDIAAAAARRVRRRANPPAISLA